MKIDKNKRQVITAAQNITSAIAEKLYKSKDEEEPKIDLTKIAKDLAERRAEVLKNNEEEE